MPDYVPPRVDDGALSQTIGKYASSIIVKQVLGVLNAYLKPLMLAPTIYGLWNLLNTLISLNWLIHLGARTAMRYRIPANEAKSNESANRDIMGTVFYGSLFLYGSVALGLCVASMIVETDTTQRVAMVVVAVVILVDWMSGYQVEVFKGRSRFGPIITANYISALTAGLLNLVLIILFGFYGLLAALIISEALTMVYLQSQAGSLTLGRFNVGVYLDLIREGFPIISFSLVESLVGVMDRLIIAAWLGLEELGYYGIAITAFGFLMRIPDASREVVEPLLMRDLQTRPASDCLRDYVQRPLLFTAYALPLLLGPVILLLPAVVEILLPQYVRGVIPAQILTAGCLFMAMILVLRGLIIARQYQVRATGIMLVAALFSGLLNVLFLTIGWGLVGVAIASTGSFLILFMGLLRFLVNRELDMPPLSLLTLFTPMLVATIILTGVLILAEWIEVAQWVSGSIGCVIFFSIMIPLYNLKGMHSGYWQSLNPRTILGRYQR